MVGVIRFTHGVQDPALHRCLAALLQTGYVYHYAFAVLIGAFGFVSLFVFGLWG